MQEETQVREKIIGCHQRNTPAFADYSTIIGIFAIPNHPSVGHD
jgi:hypothetical protein